MCLALPRADWRPLFSHEMTNLFMCMSASGGLFTDTYYLQSSAQRGSNVDPSFFHVFPVRVTFFPGWVQPPTPPPLIFSLICCIFSHFCCFTCATLIITLRINCSYVRPNNMPACWFKPIRVHVAVAADKTVPLNATQVSTTLLAKLQCTWQGSFCT